MNKKILIPIIAILILTAGAGAYFAARVINRDNSPQTKSITGKCGDGVCGPMEKQKGACPRDCATTSGSDNAAVDNNTETTSVLENSFISGFKIQNTGNIDGLSEATFKIAGELGLDYVLVPVLYPKSGTGDPQKTDWAAGLNYPYIFELADKYNVSILPAFYKLGAMEDKNYEKYASFVISFLNEFYEDGNINYIEFQNEPVKGYDGKVSARFAGTPADLAKSNTAAYVKVKEKYPSIKVGTAGFMATAIASSDENKTMNEYYREYFSAKPKFDFLAIHEYLKTSSYLQKTSNTGNGYNFVSEYEIFDAYRQMLNDYGYSDKPIFVTEGAVDMPFVGADGKIQKNWLDDSEVSILLMERFVLALSKSRTNNIIGSMVSNIESVNNTALFGYNKTTNKYTMTKQFEFYKKLLGFLNKYPYYSGHIAGGTGSENYWIEEFKNKDGKRMWMGFCPLLFTAKAETTTRNGQSIVMAVATEKSINCPQEVVLTVGNIDTVEISTVSASFIVNVISGKASFKLEKNPVFVEE